jgi:acyl-CoA thioesterase
MSLEIIRRITEDPLAKFLGVVFEEIQAGYARTRIMIDPDKLNIHHSTHGGCLAAFTAITLGAACNSHGQIALATNIAIDYVAGSGEGDELIATAKEISLQGPLGLYEVVVRNAKDQVLLLRAQATAYRRKERFFE